MTASALRNQLSGVAQQRVTHVVGFFSQTDTAGIIIVDDQRRSVCDGALHLIMYCDIT